jgi:hypothetical protein
MPVIYEMGSSLARDQPSVATSEAEDQGAGEIGSIVLSCGSPSADIPSSSIIPVTSVALAPGTRLGPYEVVAQIGAGGMGGVYRGSDSKLNRDVALNVPSKAVAAAAERPVP